jgi:hypothetical protein
LAATVISFVTSASECVPVKSTDGWAGIQLSRRLEIC